MILYANEFFFVDKLFIAPSFLNLEEKLVFLNLHIAQQAYERAL